MIKGDKLALRAIEPEDAQRCHRWINDPEVTQFLTMRFPISMLAERKWTEREQDYTREFNLAIETLEGEHIGNCGMHRVDTVNSTAELGILIGEKSFWGQGYGTDAMLTLCAFGFCQMNLNRISLHVYDFNTRGIRCYEKCGFQHEGKLREALFRHGKYCDILVMSILADEYKAMWPQRWGSGLAQEG